MLAAAMVVVVAVAAAERVREPAQKALQPTRENR
jgi:hypothetical protein